LGETAFLACLDESESTFTAAQEFRGTRGIGEAGRRAGEEDQTRLLIADGRGGRLGTAAVAQDASERHAREN
jgi:hypothetical protein